METFLQLPSATPAHIAVKFAFVAAGCLLAWWLVALLLLQRKPSKRSDPRNRAELNIAICSFWSAVIVFPLLQLYTLLKLNYNLGDLGVGAMLNPRFYVAFVPEYLAGALLIGFILLKRKSILNSIDLKRLEADS